MIIEMYNEASADTDDRSVLVVREGGMSVLNKIRRSVACFELKIRGVRDIITILWSISETVGIIF